MRHSQRRSRRKLWKRAALSVHFIAVSAYVYAKYGRQRALPAGKAPRASWTAAG